MFYRLTMMTTTITKKLKLKDIQDELRDLGFKTSFRKKQHALDLLEQTKWYEKFPWNEDQQTILNGSGFKEYCINGVFGSGKTCCIRAIVSRTIAEQVIPSTSIFLCAFNVSIRNEIRRKIRETGVKKKPHVRTFDSLIYELCRCYDMPNLDKPDYEGRRRFIENILGNGTEIVPIYHQIKLVLVDETQDLDVKAYHIFKSFFPNAVFYFFGDIFQSIQKEPRCSLLWHVLKPQNDRKIHFMKKTPRVPTNILGEIKTALIHHYPEYKEPITNWYSSNPLPPTDTKITWIPIEHYNDVFKHCKEFLNKYPHDKCMVLTFSSAITVRGSMGDLSRFRQYLYKENIQMNRNYKMMEDGKLFLSTVNSSKGLERPYVFIALTFPLELAFANFSNDLVVNLVSVGLSRCKTNATFCVPIYSDRFSEVLRLYPECPIPNHETIANKRHHDKMTIENISEILEHPHSITEILKQSILSYSTREELRSCAKYSGSNTFPPGSRIKWTMRNEEEASFMGILYEVLITSAWTNKWPSLDVGSMSEVQKNPMYAHCRGGLAKCFQKLVKIFHTPYQNNQNTFSILYDYTEYHILLSQKIRVRISQERKQEMSNVWWQLRNDILSVKPNNNSKIPQVNMNRRFMTGIADMICNDRHTTTNDKDNDIPLVLYEIKTCSNSDWKEDAFTQASLYMSMTQSKRGVIRLLNPFRRELQEYHISLTSKEKNVMVKVDREMLLWNLNCFLAKYENDVFKGPLKDDISKYVCHHEGVYLEFLASTKTRIVENLIQPETKIIVGFKHDEPLLNNSAPTDQDLTDWFLNQIDFVHNDEKIKHSINWNDPFSKCVLMAVYIRKTFSFK